MGISVRATNGCESVCVSLRAEKYSGLGYGTGRVSVNSGCENAFVPKGIGCQLLGTGKSWPVLCMRDGQYKQSEWAMVSEAYMSLCQQLWRLGFRSGYWAD